MERNIARKPLDVKHVTQESQEQQQQSRLRELATLYDSGLVAYSEEDLLTLALSPTGRPSKRMARIAQRIIHDCNGFLGLAQELADAPIALMRFGLSRPEVNRLKMTYDLVVQCHFLNRMQGAQVRRVEDALKLVRPELQHLRHEELHVLILDTHLRVVEYARLYKGTVNTIHMRIAEIFRPAIVRNCPSILISHNHPSSDAEPSLEDIEFTRALVKAGTMLDIAVQGHLIIGDPPSYTSLKERLQ